MLILIEEVAVRHLADTPSGGFSLPRERGDRWGRSYNLHIAAQLSLHALLSSGLTTAI